MYYQNKNGTILDSNFEIVPQIEGNSSYDSYIIYLRAGGAVEHTDYQTQEEILQNAIENEYELYTRRQQDGVDAYLRISAELRLAKLSGQIDETEHVYIEKKLEPVRLEVVLGQWITARKELLKLDINEIGEKMYHQILDTLNNYIKDNYTSNYTI